MAQRDETHPRNASPARGRGGECDLKFVPTNVNDEPGGGWYRELPDGQLEVMTRAQHECVPLEDDDPETTARATVEKMIRQQHL